MTHTCNPSRWEADRRKNRESQVNLWYIVETPINKKGRVMNPWRCALILPLLGEYFVQNKWKVEYYNLMWKVFLTSLVRTLRGKHFWSNIWAVIQGCGECHHAVHRAVHILVRSNKWANIVNEFIQYTGGKQCCRRVTELFSCRERSLVLQFSIQKWHEGVSMCSDLKAKDSFSMN